MVCHGASVAVLVLWAVAGAAAQPADGRIYVNASRSAPARALGRAVGRRLAMTSAQEQLIVDKHNTLRAGVTQPCTAADMETLQWDASLAASANAWAQQCQWNHDPNNNDGENLAMRFSSAGSSVTDAAITWSIQAWYDEVVDTQWTANGDGATSKVYSNPQSQCKSYEGPNCMIGHYTQVVWAKSNRIGCAAVVCPSGTLTGSGGFYLVCRYTPAGNWPTSTGATRAPWAVGAPCAACAGQCSHGRLCDAGATVNRCADTITTMTIGSTTYTSCATLTAARTNWCSQLNQGGFAVCDRTCGACTPPASMGLSFCGSSPAGPTPTPTGSSPTPTPTPTSGSSPTPTPTPTGGSSPTPSPTPLGLAANGATRAASCAAAAVACAAITLAAWGA